MHYLGSKANDSTWLILIVVKFEIGSHVEWTDDLTAAYASCTEAPWEPVRRYPLFQTLLMQHGVDCMEAAAMRHRYHKKAAMLSTLPRE